MKPGGFMSQSVLVVGGRRAIGQGRGPDVARRPEAPTVGPKRETPST